MYKYGMLGMDEIDLMNYYPLFKKKVETNGVWSYDSKVLQVFSFLFFLNANVFTNTKESIYARLF